MYFGRILSGDKDIVKEAERKKLFKKFGAFSVDWESAGFALTCELNGVTGLVLRVISDCAHEQTKDEYANSRSVVMKGLTQNILKICDLLN